MKKVYVLAVLTLLLFTYASVSAAPFLVCDPQAGVTHYSLTLGGNAVVTPAQTDGSLRYDVAVLPAGNTSGTVAAGRPYTMGGAPQEAMEWSSSVPFDLGKPATPNPPPNLALRAP